MVDEKLSSWEPKNLVVFAASDSGTIVYLPEAVPRTAHAVARRRGPRARVARQARLLPLTPRISPDGRKVAYSLSESEPASNDLWVLDLQYERTFRLTQKSGTYGLPAWSRDSSRLVFTCKPHGPSDLCVRSLTGGGDTEMLHASPNWKMFPGWTPDGQSLVFAEQDPDTNWDLVAVSLGGEPKSRSLLKTPFSESSPEISPDGRWIAYTSVETGRTEVNVRPLSGAFEQWQISAGGGGRPRWRGDGRELYYASPDGHLMAVAIETQPVFRPGPPRRLFQLTARPDRNLPIFEDVTPDGRRFLLNAPVEARSSVAFHVIANWRSLLDSRAE